MPRRLLSSSRFSAAAATPLPMGATRRCAGRRRATLLSLRHGLPCSLPQPAVGPHQPSPAPPPLPCSRATADHLHLAKGGPDGCLVPFIEEEGAKEAEDVWVRAIGRWWPATWRIWLSAVMTEPRVQDGLHRRRPWR
jgi:hypothetical protein